MFEELYSVISYEEKRHEEPSPVNPTREMMQRLCPSMQSAQDIYAAFVIVMEWPSTISFRHAYDRLAQLESSSTYETELYKLMSQYLTYKAFDTPTLSLRDEFRECAITFIRKYHLESDES